MPTPAKLVWYYDHAPGETLDLDEVFERVLVDDQGQNYVFSAGKTGILWKLDRKTGKYLGHKEMVFQNVYDSINPTTGEPHYRNDIVEQRIGDWVPGCPSTEGGKNWPAMSYYQPGNRLIVPAQPELSGPERAGDRQGGRRRLWRWRAAALLGDAGIERQRRQAGGIRCADDARDLEVRAARAVPDRSALHRGRRWRSRAI